jgi:hypothetical protein
MRMPLLNLVGNAKDCWNRGKEPPMPLAEVALHIQVLGGVRRVWYATPDAHSGRATALPFSLAAGDTGKILTAVIPKVDVAGLLWFDVDAL